MMVDGTNEDNIITIADDTGETPEATPTPEEAPAEPVEKETPKPRESNYSPRINKLAQENSYLKSQIAIYQNELAEKEKVLEKRRLALESAEKDKRQYAESQVDLQERDVKRQLAEAKHDGDIDKEVELIAKLGEIKADKSALQVIDLIPDYDGRSEPASNETVFHADPAQESSPELSYELQEFYENNPWADRNSDVYDSRMEREANKAATLLSESLEEKGESHLIGKSSFYSAIASYVSKKFNEPVEKRDFKTSSDSGVQREGASMADVWVQDTYGNNHKAIAKTLTPTELAIARNISLNINGRAATEKEKIDAYAKNKASMNRITKPTDDGFYHVSIPEF